MVLVLLVWYSACYESLTKCWYKNLISNDFLSYLAEPISLIMGYIYL